MALRLFETCKMSLKIWVRTVLLTNEVGRERSVLKIIILLPIIVEPTKYSLLWLLYQNSTVSLLTNNIITITATQTTLNLVFAKGFENRQS